MRQAVVLLGLVLFWSGWVAGQGTVQEGTVYYQGNQFSFKAGVDPSGVAFGTFNDTLQISGWGVLKIQTNKAFDDKVQMEAAGFLEGYLTAARIKDNYLNVYRIFFESSPSNKLLQFLKDQDAWVRSNTAGNYKNLSPFWQQVAFIQAQFDGLYEGYNSARPTDKLDVFAFQLLNDVGDLLDLLPALHAEKRPNWNNMTLPEIRRKVGQSGHCSALVKLNGDMSELWAAHSSWFTYSATNRIFKHYFFDLSSSFVAAKKMSFSSYAGYLESLDDFYMMSSGLTMLQTTNSVFNQDLYKKIVPQSLFAWQRVRLANSMASTGQQWCQLISQYNSGTYNNQYMVVDYKLFQPKKQVLPGTLWVCEQIPGLVQLGDVTEQLERGYWASYNVPYFPDVYNQSGYPDFVRKHGVEFSYQMAPRAQIFRRDQGNVVDMDSFKAIMRYNNYKNDPYSEGDPGKAICSRFDLESSGPAPSGCYDTKVTSYALQSSLISEAINGPTTSNGLPPFSWSSFNKDPHVGLPKVYNFGFVKMDPQWDN